MTQTTILKDLNTAYKSISKAIVDAKKTALKYEVYLSEEQYKKGKGEVYLSSKDYIQHLKNETNNI